MRPFPLKVIVSSLDVKTHLALTCLTSFRGNENYPRRNKKVLRTYRLIPPKSFFSPSWETQKNVANVLIAPSIDGRPKKKRAYPYEGMALY